MATIVKNKNGLVVPPAIQRRAGIAPGDPVEIKAIRGVITIISKPATADDEYTTEQRRIIDREVAKGLEDVKKGRVYGPFTPKQATRFLKGELKARPRKAKPIR